MNWTWMRMASWIDTRAQFVGSLPKRGRLLDLGSSDGGTLRHFAELRPDLALAAGDIEGRPEAYPRSTDFRRSDFERDPLPWPDGLFDGVTCMHVVEHLQDPSHLMREAFRVLAPRGGLYVETPAPETVDMKSATGRAAGRVTVNFFDDPTHVRPVTVEDLSAMALHAGFESTGNGVSRSLLFSAAYPVLRVLRPDSRGRYVAQLHWTGWSVYMIARKPGRER